ncbi:hypothetical protein HXX76_009924 [Chlamydomonas incerta]|uniref:Uncharacterized protein n=1 Tax=Chlamydomonas incerta TaxID=51695 RepID=A0A835SPJ0_CHLIN|nr:hypothetical protein HXX76_009924 [Chlamydomonas incerta]|eukprot:KAG2430957.1 hypothetical protein HXX76_009924 [Chlamydomonas incerta]
MTPPTGASKPTYQPSASSARAEEEPADTSYFPEQVSLNIGGGGFGKPVATFGAPPAQSSSLQSFQPMDSAPLAQAPVSQPAMLPALGTQPSMQRAQMQQQQQQQQYQQQYQQPQQLQTLPSLQQKPPELADEPEAAAAPPPPPPPAPTDDIWSSLQSAYRIKDPPAGPASAHSKASSGPGRKGAPSGEVLVLGDDDPFSGGKGMPAPNLNGTMNRTSGFGGRGSQGGNLPPPRPAAAAKSGGWGAGNMAQAGELMIGAADDDWLESGGARQQLPAAGGFGGRGATSQRNDEYGVGGGGGYNQPAALNKAPLAQGRPADDIMCEDVEDVDMMLEDEMQGISDKNLANKLAAFDAQFNDD